MIIKIIDYSNRHTLYSNPPNQLSTSIDSKAFDDEHMLLPDVAMSKVDIKDIGKHEFKAPKTIKPRLLGSYCLI